MLPSPEFEPFEFSFVSPDPQATATLLVISHHLIIAIWGYTSVTEVPELHAQKILTSKF